MSTVNTFALSHTARVTSFLCGRSPFYNLCLLHCCRLGARMVMDTRVHPLSLLSSLQGTTQATQAIQLLISKGTVLAKQTILPHNRYCITSQTEDRQFTIKASSCIAKCHTSCHKWVELLQIDFWRFQMCCLASAAYLGWCLLMLPCLTTTLPVP